MAKQRNNDSMVERAMEVQILTATRPGEVWKYWGNAFMCTMAGFANLAPHAYLWETSGNQGGNLFQPHYFIGQTMLKNFPPLARAVDSNPCRKSSLSLFAPIIVRAH